MPEVRTSARHRGRRLVSATTVGALVVSGLAAMPALAAPTGTVAAPPVVVEKSAGRLSPLLEALARPTVRSAPQDARSGLLGLPDDGPGSLLQDEQGRVLLQVSLTDTDWSTVAEVASFGELVSVSEQMRRATVRVPVSRLAAIGSAKPVVYAKPVLAPRTSAHRVDPTVAATAAAGTSSAPRTAESAASCNSVISEADTQLRAADARETFDVDGTGVKVGILSDSYDVAPDAVTSAADDIASGDLPGAGNPCGRTAPVEVLEEIAPPDPGQPQIGGDEGRAMAQLVHDLAPGAQLSFASAFNGQDSFAENIRVLAADGADIIVDDVMYLDEPMFQSGVIDQAVTDVTAQGVSYFSSAGNSNVVFGGRNVASWETAATRGTSCPVMYAPHGRYEHLGDCVDFDPRKAVADHGADLTIGPGGVVQPVMQWAEPEGRVTQDFDLFLVDATTGDILAASLEANISAGSTTEYLYWRNQSSVARDVKLVVNHYGHDEDRTLNPRLKITYVALSNVRSMEYTESWGTDVVGPAVFGHNGGASTISVGAVPYHDSSVVESFSSRGPVTHYFAPSAAAGASPLPAPKVITAPNLAATDGAATTFFAQRVGSTWRFYGTSAAAPHAAAVAALLLEKEEALSPAEVRARLQATANPVGTASQRAVGAGLVDARRALAADGSPYTPVFDDRSPRPVVEPIVAPGAPRVTKTVAAKGRAVVTFAPPTSTGGAPISAYTASCSSNRGGVTRSVTRAGSSTAPLTVSRLTTGVPYRCVVTARNVRHASGSGAPGPVVVPTGLAKAPTGVKAKAVKKRKITVRFKAPSNTGGLRVTKYSVTCRPTKAGKVRTASGTRTRVTVTKLSKRKVYRCTVVATNAHGKGAESKKSKKVKVKR